MRKLVTTTVGGLVLALLAACSASAPTDPSMPVDVGTVTSALNPGDHVTVPNGDNYTGCKLTLNGVSFNADARFVVRLKPQWVIDASQAYGYSDPYMLPFPTPWISPTSGGSGCLNPVPASDCVYAKDAYNYEAELEANVPGLVPHQFLVYVLQNCRSDGNGNQDCIASTNYFYNGTPSSYIEVSGRNKAVQDYSPANGITDVDPSRLNCVYVMQQSGSTIVPSGYHSWVAQSHDPINYPD
jgi:hypothetical protein